MRHTEPSSYIGWADYLKRARDGYSRPLSSNKRIHWVGERAYGSDIALRLHSTDVVTFHADGTYSIRTNGWTTGTTKACISRFSPAKVYSEKGIWYVEAERDPADPEPACSWRPAVPEPFTAAQPGASVGSHDCGLDESRPSPYGSGYRYCAQCSQHSYAESRWASYSESIALYGSESAWRAAFKESRKEHRAARKVYLAWHRRNRLEFFDGVRVNAAGYVPRGEFLKAQRAQARAQKEAEVADRKAERVQARVKRAQAQAERATAKRCKALAQELGLTNVLVSPEVVDWLASKDVEVRGAAGTAILCKAVNGEYESVHGSLYVPGCATLAADYDPTPTCGRGLHFSPSEAEARTYARAGDVRALACEVPLDSLVPIGADKCKALSCKVLGPWTGRGR